MNGSLLAAAALTLFTARACLFAQENINPSSPIYGIDVSTSTRYIFSPYLEDTIVILPGVYSGEASYQYDVWRSDLPFMREFPEVFDCNTVLDIGTGSGILALYAAKLGAVKVVATDIDPQALKNTKLNARLLKLDSVIKTRLVSPDDPSAYAVIRPDEVFDVVIANAAQQLEELVDLGKNARPKLGLSIVNGLKLHLKPGGSVILLYRSKFLHDMMVGYARYLGYDVEHHEAVEIRSRDWC